MTVVSNFASLKIVTIEPLYDNWENSLARDLFGQIVDVKLKGFGAHYPYGVMPIDTSDFISTHHLICREEKGVLEVLSAFKTIDLKKSLIHNLTFPALGLVKLAGDNTHIQAVENVLDDAIKNEKSLIYSGSYTMSPAARENKVLLKMMRDIFNTMYVSYYLDNKIDEVLVGATMRFKMHELFGSMGYENLKCDEEDTSPIYVEHLAKEKVQLMHLKTLSSEAFEMTKEYDYLWKDRLTISNNIKESKDKKSA